MDLPDGVLGPQSSAKEENSELGKRRSGLRSNQWLREKVSSIQTLYLSFSEGNVERSAFAQEVEELLTFLRSEDTEGISIKRAKMVVENIAGRILDDPSESHSKHEPLSPWVEAALGNELVLKNTFKYLSFTDLKDCKRVNKVWNKVSNETMAGRYTFIKPKRLRGSQEGGNFEHPFNELRACIERNEYRWPAPGLVLNSEDWVSNPEAQGFIQTFGASIKRVIVGMPDDASMLTLLEKRLPNVESIELVQSKNSNTRENTIDAPVFSDGTVLLPYLKSLRLPRDALFDDYLYDYMVDYGCAIRAILSAAVNLKIIENVDSRFTEDLARLNKLHTVQHLNVDLDKEFLTKKIAATKFPNLKAIRVALTDEIGWHESAYIERAKRERERIVRLFRDFMSLHSDTLEELELPAVFKIEDIIPTQMSNLRALTISGSSYGHEYKYVTIHADDCQTAFPALKEVRVTKGKYLATQGKGAWPQVEDLVCCPRTVLWKEVKFPNVTCLHLHSLDTLTITTNSSYDEWGGGLESGRIWKLELPLKVLEFIDFSLVKYWPPDSFFTGLPERTCEKLRERPKAELDLDFIRTEASVCNYKDLRQFKLGICNAESTTGELGVLSQVSHWYGFGCIQGLQVVISYDFRHPGAPRIAEAIEAIRPFVTVVHKDEE